MALRPTLVFCAGGNKRNVAIATAAGFRYGARLPSTVHPNIAPLWFADQDWRKPNREAYVNAVARHRPTLASVLDWERDEQLAEVLSWAEDIAPHVDMVMLIPKVNGGIARLPRQINGRTVVLGYSAPTKFGATGVPIWEFFGWPIHILGGSPNQQMAIWSYLHNNANVISIDGNYAQRLAHWCCVWQTGKAWHAVNRRWPTLRELGMETQKDAPYVAFKLSCHNIVAAWTELCGGATTEQ